MKFEITELDAARKKIEVTVPAEDVNKKIEETFGTISKTARLDGFRKGKIPSHLIEKHFGAYVREHVSNELIKESLNKALEDAKVIPVAPPAAKPGAVKKGEDFSFSAEIEVMPVIEKMDYAGIEVEVPSADVTETHVDATLQNVQRQFTTVKKPDTPRTAIEGDVVTVDFDAVVEDKKLGSEKDLVIEIGEGRMPEEMEKQLVGKKEGDAFSVSVEYPKEAGVSPELVGKKVSFNVTLKDIKEKVVPALDDEFAKDVGKESLVELREHLKQQLLKRRDEQRKNYAEKIFLAKLCEKNPVALPPTMVESQRRMLIQETKEKFTNAKIPFDESHFDNEFLDNAKERVHEDILLHALADSQNVQASAEEIDAYINRWASEIGQNAEKMKAALKAEDRLDFVEYRVRREKTLEFLASVVTIKYVEKKDSEPKSEATEEGSEKKE